MELPFDRDRLKERNVVDAREETEAARSMTPEQRVALGLALSNQGLAMARDASAEIVSEPLSAEAKRYVAPLLALMR